MDSTEIKEISPRYFQPGTTTVIFAGRGAGKTTIIKWIMYYWHKKIRLPLVVSHTADSSGDYANIVPDSCIHREFSDELIKRVIGYCCRMKSLKDSNNKKFKGKLIRTLLVLDDVDSAPGFKNSIGIRELLFDGRHNEISLIVTCHDPMVLGASSRDNIDYVIIRSIKTLKRQKAFYEQYCSDTMFGSFGNFQIILKACIADYGAMVIDFKNKASNKLQDSVFCLRTHPPGKMPKFRIGARIVWKAHEKRYNKDWKSNYFMRQAAESSAANITIRAKGRK